VKRDWKEVLNIAHFRVRDEGSVYQDPRVVVCTIQCCGLIKKYFILNASGEMWIPTHCTNCVQSNQKKKSQR
jgi:hypothetical protein